MDTAYRNSGNDKSIMALPRACVGFSSTDVHHYRRMLTWRTDDDNGYHFTDCRLHAAGDLDDEAAVKRRCRQHIEAAGKYVMLIGRDTRHKHRYVTWEAEVAIEKGCTIIGVNLDGRRQLAESLCPPVIRNVGAVFVAYSPRIVAHALENFERRQQGNFFYLDAVYQQLRIMA